MKNVQLDPIGQTISVQTETRVLDALLAEELNVLMACGGHGLCATCHVYVDAGMDQLTPVNEREQRALGWITGANEKSRLACQARILGEGVVVRVPEGMYIQSAQDLEGLIGQRATADVRHPFDGRVLIQKGKLITRSSIRELQSVDFDVSEIRTKVSKRT